MMDDHEAVRRYFFVEEDLRHIAALPEDEQAKIDAQLNKTFGGAKVRVRLAVVTLGKEIVRACRSWMRRLWNR